MVVAFRLAASSFKDAHSGTAYLSSSSLLNALVAGPEVQSFSAPLIVPDARLVMFHWIHVIDEDAASVLSAFTPILKQALGFPSSCPDSVLVHGPPCSLAKHLGVAVMAGYCCDRQLAARLTRMGRNR